MTEAPRDENPLPEELTDEVELSSGGTLAKVLSTVVVPGLILVFGVFCMGLMVATRSGPERTTPEAAEQRVVARPIQATTRTASIQGTGAVSAARQVRLTAQVQGRITSIASDLTPGRRFRQGEVLATIDPRDYRAAVAAQEQAVAQAELQLATERNRAALAKKEWELLGKKGEASPLTLRIPHVHAAEKALSAAEASLDQAKANLSRTRITAPFNGIVTDEALEVGQLVGPTSPVGTLVGTDAFWVEVSMPVEKLDGITFPEAGERGSAVEVVQKLGAGREVRRQGYVKQLGGQLDPQSRTATVLVEVPDPYDVPGLPMLPNAHVSVSIDGKALQDTWEVPRSLLEEGSYVWIVDQESSLRRRELTIGWRTPETIIATGGLQAGDQLVTENLPLPVEGAVVTVEREEG